MSEDAKKVVAVVAALPDHLINFREHLLSLMVAEGHRVVAYGAASDALGGVFRGGIAQRLREIGVEYRPLPLERTKLSPFTDLKLLARLDQEFRGLRPDLVFPFHTKPVIYGSLAARRARVPRCCSLITGLGYGMREARGRSSYRLMHRLYRTALTQNDTVIFQNDDDERLFFEDGILNPGQATVVVNGSGVDLGHYGRAALPSGPLTFLMIARLVVHKGVREFVEAARIVRRNHPSVRFVLVGPAEEHPASLPLEEVQAIKDEGVVEVRGGTDDVRPFLEACHVFVLPSYGEGTPRTVLEAMSVGRVVIVSDAPGCRQTIEHEKSGLIVPVKDAEALAAAMERFIETPSLIGRMSVEARRRAEAMYDVRKVNEAMMQALGLR